MGREAGLHAAESPTPVAGALGHQVLLSGYTEGGRRLPRLVPRRRTGNARAWGNGLTFNGRMLGRHRVRGYGPTMANGTASPHGDMTPPDDASTIAEWWSDGEAWGAAATAAWAIFSREGRHATV